jgi:outer membrane protein, heavy metal efflux system
MRLPALARAARSRIGTGALVCLICFGTSFAGAQSPPNPDPVRPVAQALEPTTPLTLHEALALALAGNPDLAVALREVEATQAAVLQGSARPNPELSTLIEDTRSATRTTTIQISQPIELGGKRAARIDAAQRERDIATADLRTRRAELRAAVGAAFHAVLAAQERVQLSADSAELARRASDAAAKRVQAGKVSPVEETKARVAEAVARLEAAQAQSDLRSARQSLAATWGSAEPRFERAQAPDSGTELPPLPTADALARRVTASPALARAQVELERRRALTAVDRAKRVPDLTLSLGMKRDTEIGRSQAIVGLAIPLPVFDTNRGGLLEALRREDKARDELAALHLRLRVEALLLRERLAAAHAEATLLRADVLPGAQSAFEAAVKGFELGKFDFLDVLDAQRTLFQARSQHLRALAEAQRAAAEIDRLLGDETEAAAQPMPNPEPKT